METEVRLGKDRIGKVNNKFIPPTIEDVRNYIEEKHYSVDAEKFIDYYTSNGWMVGRNKMKDWKAAVRNWERNNGNDFRASDRKRNGLSGANGIRTGDDEVVEAGFIPRA